MRVEFYNQTQQDLSAVESLINKIFTEIEEEDNMSIIFVTNEQIHEINKQYRDVDRPTDVISFPNDEDLDGTLGDIFISLEKASEQAESYGHSFEREVGFLAVHGYLHLKGYDHHSPEEEKEMIAKQEEILSKANLNR